MKTLSQELKEVEASAIASAETVSQLATRVQTELAESMDQGATDMQILQKNVVNVVEGTSDIVAQLEELLDSGDLDEDTAGAIEDLLFSAEDSADSIRKEALPMVRVGVERLGVTAEASRKTAIDIAALTPLMDGFAQSSKNATARAYRSHYTNRTKCFLSK